MREEEMDGGVHQKILEISQLPSTAAVAGGLWQCALPCTTAPKPLERQRFQTRRDALDLLQM